LIDLAVVRTLDRLAGEGGAFTMVALDQRASLRRYLAECWSRPIDDADLVAVKAEIVHELSPHASAFLLDPEFGAAQSVADGHLHRAAELIVTSEADGYEAVRDQRAAALLSGWNLEDARRLGANAIKVLVQYPLGNAALREQEREFVYDVADRCGKAGLAYVLEVLVTDADEHEPDQRSAGIVKAAEELSPACDLYKAEYPASGNGPAAEACRAFDEACASPWVILSGGVDWEVFLTQLRVACEAGASGFLAGRSIWKDAASSPDSKVRVQTLGSACVDRLRAASQVVDQWARPWRQRRAGELASVGILPRDWFTRPLAGS
jgi:tagatose 1,6-diphosphate aldolase